VTIGFASGEPHTAITASPMLRVSKRLTANVFREPEVEAGTSAADAAHTEAARLLCRRNHLIDNYRDFTRDFSADRVQSTSHDRGSGLELRATQRDQAIDRGMNAPATDEPSVGLDSSGCYLSSIVPQGY
jgi:hypothetical protein